MCAPGKTLSQLTLMVAARGSALETIWSQFQHNFYQKFCLFRRKSQTPAGRFSFPEGSVRPLTCLHLSPVLNSQNPSTSSWYTISKIPSLPETVFSECCFHVALAFPEGWAFPEAIQVAAAFSLTPLKPLGLRGGRGPPRTSLPLSDPFPFPLNPSFE